MPDLTMPGLTIRTLGQDTVLLGGLEPDWHADSARTLLFYLLGHPDGQPHRTIVQALWNPEPGGASVACLRVAVCRLRAALGDPGSVVTDRQRYRLARPVLERADTFQFTRDLHLARRGPPHQRIVAYGRALAHYGGDHLPLEQAEWAQPFRARLCGDAAQAGLELSILLGQDGQPGAALDALAAALHRDPLISERWHQDLMIGLAAQDRYAAVEHYRRYVRYLRAEVGDTPMRETTALAQRIKDGLPLDAAGALWDGSGLTSASSSTRNPVLERWGRA